ncbi:MAG TPA: nitroreductase family protein [Candidatus Dormibacteraeota bacterium]|nr:nitroreductase family protein [Candidatus Dormibacteraeota bacterium]
MDLYAAMRTAISTRDFEEDPVPEEILLRVLDNARFAPSGGNRQGWRVIAVDDPETRIAMAELYRARWSAYVESARSGRVYGSGGGGGTSRGVAMSPATERFLAGASRFAERFHLIPLQLVICVRLGALAIVDSKLERPSIVGGASIYPFVQNLVLAFRAEGMGATYTSLLTADEPAMMRLLDIPEGHAVAGVVSVGYRRDPFPTRLTRKPVEEFAVRNRFTGEPLRG